MIYVFMHELRSTFRVKKMADNICSNAFISKFAGWNKHLEVGMVQ